MPLTAIASPTPGSAGVYRRAPKGGQPALWYELGADGRVIDVHVMQPGERETAVALRMWDAFNARRPKLSLVRDHDVSDPQPSVLSAAALCGLFRRRGPVPPRSR